SSQNYADIQLYMLKKSSIISKLEVPHFLMRTDNQDPTNVFSENTKQFEFQPNLEPGEYNIECSRHRELCLVIDCGSLHLLPSVIGDKLCGNSQGIHQSDLWGKPDQFRSLSYLLPSFQPPSNNPVLIPSYKKHTCIPADRETVVKKEQEYEDSGVIHKYLLSQEIPEVTKGLLELGLVPGFGLLHLSPSVTGWRLNDYRVFTNLITGVSQFSTQFTRKKTQNGKEEKAKQQQQKNQDPSFCFIQETHFNINDRQYLRVKG
ncbi:hypothetical protein STEG23_007278, partial [Scotinomys teguina]